MKWRSFIAAALVASFPLAAFAQQPVTPYVAGQPVSGGNPLPTSASVSVAGFAPGGNYATLTATNVSADVLLPAGAVVAAFNTGTTAVSCVLAVGAGTATASKNIIHPGGWFAFTVGSNTHIACIDQTGSVSNVVVLSGGSGIPTGAGGGSGTGAATIADGADIALGAKADSAWISGDGTVVSVLKNIANGIGGSVPAGSAIIGGVYVDLLGSGATGGAAFQAKGCDATAYYDASTNGKTKMVTGVAGRKIYICGYVISTGGTATNVSMGSGTGTNCGTTYNQLTPAWQLSTNDKIGANSGIANGLVGANNQDDWCISTSAGNAVQAMVWYSIQ